MKSAFLILLLFISNFTYSQLFGPRNLFDSSANSTNKKGPFIQYEYEFVLDNGKVVDSNIVSQVSYDVMSKKMEVVQYDKKEISSLKLYTYSNDLLVKLVEEKYQPFLAKIVHEIEYDSSGNPILETSTSERTKNRIRYKYKYNAENQLESIHQSDNNGNYYLAKKYEYGNKMLTKKETYSPLGKDQSHMEYEWSKDFHVVNNYDVTHGEKRYVGRDYYKDCLHTSHEYTIHESIIDYSRSTKSKNEYFITEIYNYNNFNFIDRIEIFQEGKLVGLHKFYYE